MMAGQTAGAPSDISAAPRGLLGCECCGLVLHAVGAQQHGLRCPRCGFGLHAVKPQSVQRTAAWLATAVILYVPANVLPVMSTQSVLGHDSHTLLGGIHELWVGGSWGLAVIVFIASIAVPVLKIGALALLAATVRLAPRWRRLERAKLYRLIDAVGHWSMLDVYVVLLLAATVRFGPLANVRPGPGLLCFAAVVVLTMLATISFDPRLIWKEDGRRAA
jgi:paraquat-inducible protein A